MWKHLIIGFVMVCVVSVITPFTYGPGFAHLFPMREIPRLSSPKQDNVFKTKYDLDDNILKEPSRRIERYLVQSFLEKHICKLEGDRLLKAT